MKRPLGILLLILLTTSLFYTAYYSWQHTHQYDKQNKFLAEQFKPWASVLLKTKVALDLLTLDYFGFSKQKVQEIKNAQKLAKYHQQTAISYTAVFFATILVISFLSAIISTSLLAFLLSFISMLCLIVGIFTPIITISAFIDIPIFGESVLKFQSKSIIGAIQTLFENSNTIVIGIIILLFSILIPLIKSTLLLLIQIKYQKSLPRYMLDNIKSIGKWSMLDVFVLAIMITVFSIDSDKTTSALFMMGGYFFIGYVILSMLTTYVTTHISARSSYSQHSAAISSFNYDEI